MEIKLLEEKIVNGHSLKLFRLKTSTMSVEILNYGARIHKLFVKDIFENDINIVAGFDTIEEYVFKDVDYFNATIGRVTNRISDAKFTIDDKEYFLNSNDGKNALHGGNKGFDKKYWDSAIENGKLKMTYVSPDGEEGYPGNLTISVSFLLTENNELKIEYDYFCDSKTIANITNHACFNLSGNFTNKLYDHFAKINANQFTMLDECWIPKQNLNVKDTPYDFLNFKQISKNFDEVTGYDNSFIFNGENPKAVVYSSLSGVKLELFTDKPCVQFYTANFVNIDGRESFKPQCAFCLEAQQMPNAVNFGYKDSVICEKDKKYHSETIYKFSLNNLDENIDGKVLIEELLTYAKHNLMLNELDKIYTRNLMLTYFNINEPLDYIIDETFVKNLKVPDYLVKKIQAYAIRKGITTFAEKDKFSSFIMGILSPLPSVVNTKFYETLKADGIEKATTDFYDFCIKNDYIKKTAIDKNIKWDFKDENKKLEITINLSKPEKNNKDIAKLISSPVENHYPLCPLCKENEGFKGGGKIAPRTNIRTISLKMGGEDWFMQYSPYAYFDEHCIAINKKHVNMNVSPQTLNKLFDFVDVFENYFIGSNASLPYIGGSILNHEHFQGGKHLMPMHFANYKKIYESDKYPDLKIGILDWYNSVIRIEGKNKKSIIELGGKIIESWKSYENKKLMIINGSDGVLHNSLAPVLRKNGDYYYLDLILRNNIQTEDYPEGYFHAHPEYHNIKKEGIGLIEAMGLFILPARLQNQLSIIASILCGEIEYNPQEIALSNHYMHVHKDMIEYLVNNFKPDNYAQAKRIVMGRVDVVCKNILLNTCVFKDDDEGEKEFDNFVKKAIK